jgi:hypothetical protein
MLISRKSPLTGKTNVMDIAVTEEQLIRWTNREGLIQDIMPELTSTEREFLMTGYTQEDWETMFPPEDED